eukprot:3405192-Rhodomonas_salina.1
MDQNRARSRCRSCRQIKQFISWSASNRSFHEVLQTVHFMECFKQLISWSAHTHFVERLDPASPCRDHVLTRGELARGISSTTEAQSARAS